MIPDFESDPNPGNPKILFVGLGASTHTHSWIDLLSASDFNVRLFALPDGGIPPENWRVRTYLSQETSLLPTELDSSICKTLYPTPEMLQKQKSMPLFHVYSFIVKKLNYIAKLAHLPAIHYDSFYKQPIDSPQVWLRQIIEQWQPNIVQTLGLDPAGYFLYDIYRHSAIPQKWIWILQLRGGSDLALNRKIPGVAEQIESLVCAADQIICDNMQNVEFLRKMNVREEQISPLTPVPGTGGVDLNRLASMRKIKTSQSREIVFPNGYELPWSKCLPIFEALQLSWNHIAPCRIHILNLSSEIRAWFYSLPAHIRESCVLYDRISREDFFSILANSRVLLIPSLVDGVPNSLYEAMALGTFPIVSPLETINSLDELEHGRNILFARNLYPHEIADALTRAMSDDVLVDVAADINLGLVAKLADRTVICKRVNEYYRKLIVRT